MNDPFSDSYATARTRFTAEAARSGASMRRYVNPDARGVDGEALVIDTASFGSIDAARGLLIVSGTHGPEGYAGSAAQLVLLRSQAFSARDTGIRVVLVHALNPYGFSHTTRSTENNVDLNRNFIDFSTGPPRANPAYAALHPAICPEDWSDASLADAAALQRRWIEQHGFDAWIGAINAGQYEIPTGFGYGGGAPEWSNRTLKKIVARELPAVEKLGFVDWHTGLGDYGAPLFLCFNERGGAEWEQACRWWGRERIETFGGFDGAARPAYSGLVFHGVQAMVASARVTGAVIEFGTGPIEEIFDWHRRDRWIRFGVSPDDEGLRARFRAGVKDAMCPPDPAWRSSVAYHAEEIQAAALDGVARW